MHDSFESKKMTLKRKSHPTDFIEPIIHDTLTTIITPENRCEVTDENVNKTFMISYSIEISAANCMQEAFSDSARQVWL